MKKEITYEYLKENNLILMEAIVGSQSFGTNTDTSDEDKLFVYIAPMDNFLSGDYVDYVEVDKDFKGFELRKFMGLVKNNNPSILELLNTPDDCLIYKHPLFDYILEYKDQFLTKQSLQSFSGFATQQIIKAKGLDKKQNWEKKKTERRNLLDFCYVIVNEAKIPWKSWNKGLFEELFIGATRLRGKQDTYLLYYDKVAESCFSTSLPEEERYANIARLKNEGKPVGFGYKGLVKTGHEEGEKENYGISNQLRLTSIPKGENPFIQLYYDKDGYSKHCKEFKEYTHWLANRNETRYTETQSHGQKIDGKNVMHCVRVTLMGQEIGMGKGVIVRRPDREYLLDIRRGKFNLEELIKQAEINIKNMRDFYIDSDLPLVVEDGLIESIIIHVRKNFYGIK